MATIRKRRNRWQVQVRRAGHPPVSNSFLSRKDAETWARQAELEVDRTALPQDPRHLERHTLGELVIRYRDTITPLKRSAAVEKAVLNAFLRHPICSRKLSELGQGDFARYRDERLEEVTPRSLKRMLSPIQNLFEVAREEWGLPIRENPVSRLKIVCETTRRERRLRDGELDLIIKASAKTQNKLVLPIIRFALETGLRRSEILSARWGHLDREMRLLSLPRTKNGHSRQVPLSKGALAVLEALETSSEDQLIFPVTVNGFRLAWERLLRRTGIRDLHFHDLRHEAISRFFEMGLTVPEVALLSGHRDVRMLLRYAHGERERVLRLMDAREQ